MSEVSPAVQSQPGVARVTVVDVNMPFASMVGFMVKWVLASIPALLFLAIIFAVLSALLGGIFASLLSGLRN